MVGGKRTGALRWLAVGAVSFAALALAVPAGAANLFTLDRSADSIGPIAVDASGNGYVAWLHKGPPNTVMFCKLAPGARNCPAPITLPAEGASPNTPFPVLGPGGDVYVVAPSYETDEMVMWQSSNGGASFGAPWIAGAPPGGEFQYVCQVETNLDDVLAFNAYGGQYDPSQGLGTLGGSASNLEFEMSSANPDIDWTFAFYGQGCVEPYPEKPHQSIPEQHFSFGGGGGEESSLGWVGGAAGECALSYPGDEVDAYEERRQPSRQPALLPLQLAHRAVLGHRKEHGPEQPRRLERPDRRHTGCLCAPRGRRRRAVPALRRRRQPARHRAHRGRRAPLRPRHP